MKWSLINVNKFNCKIDYSLKNKVKSFKEEVKDHLINIIEKNKDKEIYLLFSGGMDSRFLALTLLDIGVDFTLVTYSFDIHFKDVDAVNSLNFVKEHNLKHEIFYLNIMEVSETVLKYEQINFFIPVLNTYYILAAINRYYKPDRIFITGAGSEPKIIDKQIPISYNSEKLKQLHPFIYNFTSDKIILSFANEQIVKDNWKNESLDPFYVRDKLYKIIYENLRVIKKQQPNDLHIRDYFNGFICNYYCRKYAHLFAMNSGDYYFNLETYYARRHKKRL